MSEFLGIGLVTMSTPPVLANVTGTCNDYNPKCIHRAQKVLFFIAMALIAVGAAGNLVSVKPFLDEQRNDNELDSTNAGVREICKLPAFVVVAIVPIVGAVALPYVKPWSLRFGIPAICTAAAMFLFLSGVFLRGSWAYKEMKPQGSPITSVCRVFFAAACKISLPFPDDHQYLYKENGGNEGFSHTRILRCMEKAAIIPPNTSPETASKSWRLCSISEVEDAKIAVRMLPISTTFIVVGIVSSFGNTYFIEQANRMNRRVGKWNVPLQVLLLLSQWAKHLLFASNARRLIKSHRKYGPAIGMGMAMIFSILCCITAAKMELRRLGVIEKHGLLEKPDSKIPMSVFLLLFQFFLLAGLDTFFEMSVAEFYKDQSPKCMSNYLSHFAKGVSGLGFMSSVLSVYVVGKVSEAGGGKSWFQSTLNKSRLDRYYWVLAGLGCVNLVVFVLVACCYRYRTPEEADGDVNHPGRGGTSIPPDENGSNQCCNLFG
ncbi:protein NRT1/ PTR FAMILY 5.5-like isoform X2 [Salvia miltiorrhiza]|uniref:protein NRT1/ PTR FAMILY 5.5-like isoform X2 n=1 Tax=Salvia miltiorrhiza TaxID=226208 RepID=UPI0025AD85B8|nr:protein NRT1/ PTR FAMILY 5.5-like isoform X2 [Salvia miltiorrhiza]